MNNTFINNSCTMKDFPVSERPREKLYKYGAETLSNGELIAVIIRTGYKDMTAVDLAQEILCIDDRGLSSLTDKTIEELTSIKGVGKCKAAQILACVELGKRLNRWSEDEKVRVNSPGIIADLLVNETKFLKKEHFKVAILDTKNQIVSIENISIGTLNASIVHPRDVFNIAIKKNANSIILIHNHPSGDTTPSSEDVNVTMRLVESGKLLGIKVLDHIILGGTKYLSFKEEGIM